MDLDKLTWTDVRDFGVTGKGWTDTEHFYDRFPARAKDVISPDLWERSRHAAGLRVHFLTDSPVIAADWTVLKEPIYGDKMGCSCVSGLDLYVRHNGRWRWCAMTWPDTPGRTRKSLIQEMPAGQHEYMLYLPLMNWLDSIAIGIAPDARLDKPEPQPGKPILFYGTSIVHGGCASRTGMTYPALLSRRFDRPFIGLGFGGQGRMELEVAKLLAELDPCVYVVDPLPNLQPDEVTERTEPFVHILRDARPETPIVLVESIVYQDSPFVPSHDERYKASNRALKAALARLLDAGVTGLHYVEGEDLLGQDGEGTVDGVHPTDVGFMRIADVLAPVLEPLI